MPLKESNESLYREATAVEAIEEEDQRFKMQSMGFGINKYTLFCSILASTNSILLGYGMFLLLFNLIHLFCLLFIYLFIFIVAFWVSDTLGQFLKISE